MLKNLSLTLIAVAVLSACSSSGSSPSSRLDAGSNVIGAGQANNNGNNNGNNGNNNNNGSDSNSSVFPKKNGSQPQPNPQPTPQPQPNPQPTPQPQPNPQPTPQPQPNPQPTPQPQPNPQPTPQPQPNPQPTPQPHPQPNDPVPPELKAEVDRAKQIPFSSVNLTWLQLANSGSARQEVTIDGKTYHYQDKHTSVDDDTINLADLGMGYSSRQIEYSVTPAKGALSIELDPSKKVTAKGVLTAYQRPYSVVFAEALPFFHDGVGSGTQPRFEEGCETSATATGCELFIHGDQIKTVGYSTPSETIEKFANNNQKFSYSGEAFTHAATPEKGTFNYQVAFGLDKFGLEKATSSGSITGFNSLGDITLGSGILGGSQIIGGTATASKGGRIGEYKLGFFGPNAEEVAGSGYISNEGGKNTNFGFSGAR